jgi:hypothetical protein
VTMLMVSILLYACSISSSVQIFGTYWIIINFVYASCWGAVSKIVRQKFHRREWAGQLGLIAASSRLGSLGSAILYGGILERAKKSAVSPTSSSSWRTVFRVSATIQGVVFLMYVMCDRFLLDKKNKIKRVRSTNEIKESDDIPETVSQVLRRISIDPKFWLMLAGKVSLMTVGQFISFIPLYLNTGHFMPDNEAAMKSSIFAMGSLISSVFGTRVYQTLSGNSQIRAITICNLFGFILPGILTLHHLTSIPSTSISVLKFLINFQLSQPIVLGILFFWGMAWALPFYLPAGVMALTLGGVNHAALLTNLFDAIGFLAASVLSYYAMEFGKSGQWTSVIFGLSIAGGVALTTMSRAMLLALKDEKSTGKRTGH